MITFKTGSGRLWETKSVRVAMAALAVLTFLPRTGAQEKIKDSSASNHSDPVRTISVAGEGQVSAAPDQAVVRLGVTVQLPQAGLAQAKVSETMQKALEGIVKLGLQRNSIHTAALTLTSVYSNERPSNNPETPRVVGFRANNSIEVTLQDINLVGKVIDAGISAGANELQGVSFTLKEDLSQRTTALKIAVREARTKAKTIAQALDLPLGSVLEVTEGGVHVIPFNQNFGGARMMAASAVQTPIEPGEVRVQANVTVRYEIGSPQARP
jgi:uncharacterized protein YggE